jgi:hypothetical protein
MFFIVLLFYLIIIIMGTDCVGRILDIIGYFGNVPFEILFKFDGFPIDHQHGFVDCFKNGISLVCLVKTGWTVQHVKVLPVEIE